MTRRRQRRIRISAAIEFFLKVVKNGEWTENTEIIQHLDYSTRGSKGMNSVTVGALGQFLRHIEGVERREIWNPKRSTQYRIVLQEEE